MDSGYYAAMTGLLARTQALDAAAANLANTQTPGYRAEREFFRSAVLEPDEGRSQLGQAVNRFGMLGGDELNMAQGPLEQTGNPLDLSIEGDGFFAIQTANGVRFTRDGNFHRNHMGLLVNAENKPVLSSSKQQILIPPGEVSVGADGVLSVGGGATATIGVFRFPAGAGLRAEGVNRYAVADNVPASVSSDAVVHQGSLERANEDAVQGSLDLIMMQRQAEMMQKALTVFHTEFNKIATEDLPRI
jgi:flagellar basal-body rod protein FlgF